ncbi:MAG: hypothetical protein U1E45_06190 [Geminicoccaceae bacterium]
MGERENCITVALSPETVTIDGNIVGTDDRRWSDLLLDRAVLREHSAALEALLGAEAAPPDHHLEVPLAVQRQWSARLRPRMVPGRAWQQQPVRQARFVRRDDRWLIAVYLDA